MSKIKGLFTKSSKA